MIIPRFINKLTVGQYIALRKIEAREDLDATEKVEEIISLFTGKTIEQVRELPLYKIQLYSNRIGELRRSRINERINKTIWIEGKRYKVCKNEYHLNSNQFVCAETFRFDLADNIHRLAAIIYMRKPYFKEAKFDGKAFEDLANKFLNKKLGEVYGAVFFYSKRLTRLRTISQYYLKSSLTAIAEREKEIEQQLKSLGINTAGTTSSIVSQIETLSKKTS